MSEPGTVYLFTNENERIAVIQDGRQWVDDHDKPITFDDVDEAKAWIYASFGVIPVSVDDE